ncbi:MAG: anthranilate phosphoribosyltransferase [Patescibacteria group bacterium]
MNNTQTLNKLIENKNLTLDETKEFFDAVLNGDISSIQLAAILVALRIKGETTDEILGLIHVMREHMLPVNLPDALDVCGTGGDGSNTFNISTAVAFVVAGAGIKIAKHGNRAASSKCGSADVLEALGVHIQLTPQQAEEVFAKIGMVFLFAPAFHPALKHVASVRKELGIRTIFNFLGPFVNPASVKNQLIGVPDLMVAKRLNAVAKKLPYERLVLVTSEDGMDEVSLSAKTHLFAIDGINSKQSFISPEMYGFTRVPSTDLLGGTAPENAQMIQDILSGVAGPKRDIVLFNAAVALYAAGKVDDITSGITLAEESIASGRAKKVLENLIKETHKYA